MSIVTRIAFVAAVSLGVAETSSSQVAPAPAATFTVTETRLGPVDAEMLSPTMSPDGRHLAYVARRGQRFCVVVDGQSGPEYDQIGKSPADKTIPLIFSPDGTRLGYQARIGQKWVVVVDNQPSPECDDVGRMIYFSPESKRVAFSTHTLDGWSLNVDGKAATDPTSGRQVFIDSPADPIFMVVFSPDGGRIAYSARVDGADHLFVDGRADAGFPSVIAPVFSPDGQHIAYIGHSPSKDTVVVDGHAGSQYAKVVFSSVRFSPNGERMAYVTGTATQGFAVVDGKDEPHFNGVTNFRFSPDGNHFAYQAKLDQQDLIIVDGRPIGKHDHASDFVFSPDSKHIACVAEEDPVRQFVVLDGVPGPDCALVHTPVQFSADSNHLAYLAEQTNEKWSVVVDGKVGQEYDRVAQNSLTISPDGLHVAYVAYADQSGAKALIVNDDHAAAIDSDLATGHPIFSADSKHLAYVAGNGQTMRVVLDGQSGGVFDHIWCDKAGEAAPVFNTAGDLEFLATKDNTLCRIQYLPPQ